MSELTNRASYLTGLAEGLKLDTEKPEGKLIDEMLKLISEMAEALEAIDDEQAFVADKLDEMEEVIDIIGENVFGDDEDDDVYTLVCDKCGAEIDFTEDDLDELANGEFICPECGAEIELNFDECDCGCDCDCD
ncbi:MAG: CD1247 N-terminal domain-containing protein [Monoglobaceae bacterium]